jgi:hypothetical protein
MENFKIGDTIVPKEEYNGLCRATITGIDDKYYYLKIVNGIATLPISAIDNYKLENI